MAYFQWTNKQCCISPTTSLFKYIISYGNLSVEHNIQIRLNYCKDREEMGEEG